MPNPPRSQVAAPANKAEPNKPTGPLWARAVHHFYDPIFDIRSGKAFQSAINDFVVLPADERAFHETHLLYRLVQGLEGIHGTLVRIEHKLDGTSIADLSALEHLEPIRAALEELASNPPSLMQIAGWGGEEEPDIGDEDEDQHADDDPDDEDPDFIYDTVPEEEPARPRAPRRPAPSEPSRVSSPRTEPPRAPEPEREALVGELVPATEGPQGDAEGDR